MPSRHWRLIESRTMSQHYIFDLWADRYWVEPEGPERDFTRLDAPDWINIIPITAENEIVLVRQFRHGIREATLEIPGGMVDRGESPRKSAVRELAEETGYDPRTVRKLGQVWTNPAFMTNRCHFYLAEGCRRVAPPRPDPYERIEVVLRPWDSVPTMIEQGEITHSLVILALAYAGIVPKGPSEPEGA